MSEGLRGEFLRRATATQSGLNRALLERDGFAGKIDAAAGRVRGAIVGQDAAIGRLASVLKSKIAERFIGWEESLRTLTPGWDRRPIASLLAVGATGTGKTETAKLLADELFSGAIVTLHCSEVGDESRHGVSMWTGSPPGYVGSDRGGVLTDALRAHSACMILVDEVEKASPSAVQNILLPLLGDGVVTDRNNGETLWASDCIVYCTGNLEVRPARLAHIGFSAEDAGGERDDGEVRETLRGRLLPEVVGRFNGVLVFEDLDEQARRQIWSRLVEELCRRIGPGTRIAFEGAAEDYVAERLIGLEGGARGIQDLFRAELVPLAASIRPGEHARMTMVLGRLSLDLGEDASTP